MKAVTVLGSTGSIGVSTLDVIARHPDLYRAVALSANRDVNKMVEQCKAFKPMYAVMADATAAEQLQKSISTLGLDTQVLSGVDGLKHIASMPDTDYVMAAIVGAAGLLPTLAAAEAGKRILLANKEALVMSGAIFMDTVKKNNAQLLPVDSEHNAVFQCMPANHQGSLAHGGIKGILLTASGGPFRSMSIDALHEVTPDQACAHPNWEMGRKISVDSASMMNKGLEVIEARWLFDAAPSDINVVIHPQSVIHSLVQYVDGSVLAQLGSPDMRTPIAYSLAWPDRIEAGVKTLDLFEVARLDFEAPDMERFKCLALAYQALERGGTATAILNAANEIAVDAFLNEQIRFTAIPDVITHVMGQVAAKDALGLDEILQSDNDARMCASEFIKGCSKN